MCPGPKLLVLDQFLANLGWNSRVLQLVMSSNRYGEDLATNRGSTRCFCSVLWFQAARFASCLPFSANSWPFFTGKVALSSSKCQPMDTETIRLRRSSLQGDFCILVDESSLCRTIIQNSAADLLSQARNKHHAQSQQSLSSRWKLEHYDQCHDSCDSRALSFD
jgi:hypothetical protein